MKFYDWIELKTIKLNKKIILNESEPDIFNIKNTDIEEIEYEPKMLSQKVFSFSLFFKYDEEMKFNMTYIYGLIFNYRMFLKFYREYFEGYKFRVYIDRDTFYENPFYLFYLAYLKNLENELLNSTEINYEHIEIITCNLTDKTLNKVITPTFRFLPVFEGCECHCRDLDFRLTYYDVELIKIFNESKYPLYFISKPNFNPTLAGGFGGNIKNNFKIHNKVNKNLLKLFNPLGFFALVIMYSSLLNVAFGFDEFVLRQYFDMFATRFCENYLIFGTVDVTKLAYYVRTHLMCINQLEPYYDNYYIFGVDMKQVLYPELQRMFKIFPQLLDYKLDFYSSNIKDQFVYLNSIENGFINLVNLDELSYSSKFFDNDIILKKYREIIDEFKGGGVIKMTEEEVKKFKEGKEKEEKIHKARLDFLRSEFLKKFNFYNLMDKSISIEYTFDVLNNPLYYLTFDKIRVCPYFIDNFIKSYEGEKTYSEKLLEMKTKINSEKFEVVNMYDEIQLLTVDDPIQLISLNNTTKIISNKNEIIFTLSNDKELLDIVNSADFDISKSLIYDPLDRSTHERDMYKKCNINTSSNIKIIYFTNSKHVFLIYFNLNKRDIVKLNEDIRNIERMVKYHIETIPLARTTIDNSKILDNLCLFGVPRPLFESVDTCHIYKINDLKFFTKDDIEFNPLELKIGGTDYYHKYIKYKNKYLTLKRSINV